MLIYKFKKVASIQNAKLKFLIFWELVNITCYKNIGFQYHLRWENNQVYPINTRESKRDRKVNFEKLLLINK